MLSWEAYRMDMMQTRKFIARLGKEQELSQEHWGSGLE